jgi:hypothetical protein
MRREFGSLLYSDGPSCTPVLPGFELELEEQDHTLPVCMWALRRSQPGVLFTLGNTATTPVCIVCAI